MTSRCGFDPIRETDVLVIGAGPAGCMAAREAARKGAQVLLVERKKKVGTPVRCGEYVPRGVSEFVDVPAPVIAQRVPTLATVLPSGRETEILSPGYIIHRDRFDQHLAADAVRAGAELWCNTRAVGRRYCEVHAECGGQRVQIRAKVVLGADGPRSLVSRWLGNPVQPTAVGIQHTVEYARPLERAEVHFRPAFPGGYGWVFPKGPLANVGVAVDPVLGGCPHVALKHFLDDLRARGRIGKGLPLRRTGGLVPVSGLQPVTRKGCWLLVGDAAGHTHPITGAGVHHALVCGWIAGGLAGEAVLRGDTSLLDEYETRCREWIGAAVKRALSRREHLTSVWQTEGISDPLVRETWVAFHDYYRRAV